MGERAHTPTNPEVRIGRLLLRRRVSAMEACEPVSPPESILSGIIPSGLISFITRYVLGEDNKAGTGRCGGAQTRRGLSHSHSLASVQDCTSLSLDNGGHTR